MPVRTDLGREACKQVIRVNYDKLIQFLPISAGNELKRAQYPTENEPEVQKVDYRSRGIFVTCPHTLILCGFLSAVHYAYLKNLKEVFKNMSCCLLFFPCGIKSVHIPTLTSMNMFFFFVNKLPLLKTFCKGTSRNVSHFFAHLRTR